MAPALFALFKLKSAVLETERFVAAAAFLADGGERRLQRVEILDLGLRLRHDLGEARDLGLEAGFAGTFLEELLYDFVTDSAIFCCP